MKKRSKRTIMLAAALAAIAAAAVAASYTADQAKVRGGIFGDALKQIQDDLKAEQDGFDARVAEHREGKIGAAELEQYAEGHYVRMASLAERYDALDPPPGFGPAVGLFKLSTQAQLDRDRQIVLYEQTGDAAHSQRADLLHQESFEYELAALGAYKEAQTGTKQ